MKAEHLIEMLEERPFVPLLLHLSNGRIHEIRHPEMAIVSEELVTIGLPAGDDSLLADRVSFCSTSHIVEAEQHRLGS
jgi:hypothetical protein